MNLREIERDARALMTMHGVGRLGFEFDNGKRRIGAMHYARIGDVVIPQKITLSKHFAQLLTPEEIRETILHEIAHALTPGDGHGSKWKAKARELGARPQACKAASARPDYSWTAHCPNDVHGQIIGQHRAPLRAAYICVKCKQAMAGTVIVQWRKHGNVVPLHEMPQRFQTEARALVNRGFLLPSM